MSLLPLPASRTAAAALSVAAACAVPFSGGTGVADAATISPQAELRAPKTFPIDMFGGFRQGRPIPRGAVLLRRKVELEAGERRARTTFRCPRRMRVRSIGMNDPSDVGFLVPRDQDRYTTRRTLRLELFSSPQARQEKRSARGRVYVLCRPRKG